MNNLLPHQAKLYEQALMYIIIIMQGQENIYGGLRTRTAVLEHVRRSFARSGVHWPTNQRVIVTLTLLKVGCNLWGHIKQLLSYRHLRFHDG